MASNNSTCSSVDRLKTLRLGRSIGFLLGMSLLCCAFSLLNAANLSDWKKSIAAKAANKDVYCLFALDDKPGYLVKNLKSKKPFSEMMVNSNPWFSREPLQDCPEWVEGRWPGKSALRIGTAVNSICQTHFYNTGTADFAIEAWIRPLPESAGGADLNAVVASVGNGYNSGWRLGYNRWSVFFALGAPKHRVNVSAKSVLSPGIWHQLVAMLNGKNVQLYVDGKLAAEKMIDWHYSQPPSQMREDCPEKDNRAGLVFGSSRYGVTSESRFDIDEIAIYSKALTSAEVAKSYKAGNPDTPPDNQRKRLETQLGQERFLSGVRLGLSNAGWGYFPNDKPIMLQAKVDAGCAALLNGVNNIEFEVKNNSGESVLKGDESFYIQVGREELLEIPMVIAKCGLYQVDAKWLDPKKKTVKTARLSFAVRLPLPDPADVPKNTFLSSYGGKEINSLGIKTMRVNDHVYHLKKDGTPNYRSSDEVVKKYLNKGYDLMYTIMYPPRRPEDRSMTLHQYCEFLAHDGLSRWKEYVRGLAERYKGRIKYWEVINEPNGGGHFAPRDYVTVLKAAYGVLKDVDPENVVVGFSGTSCYHTWSEQVLAAGGGNYIDVLSLHNYFATSPIQEYFGKARLKYVRDCVTRYVGRQLPIWNTECGIHQPMRIDGRSATDEELTRFYGPRAKKTSLATTCGVDAITMANEHVSACWQVQHLLMELADGVKKHFLLMRPNVLYPGGNFCESPNAVTEKGIAVAALQSLLVKCPKARFVDIGITHDTGKEDNAAGIMLMFANGKNTVALFADKPIEQVFKAGVKAGVKFSGMDYLGNPLEFVTGESGLLTVELKPEVVYIFDVDNEFAANPVISVAAENRDLIPNVKTELIATVVNPFDRAVKAELQVNPSHGNVVCEPTTFELSPRGEKKINVTWNPQNVWRDKYYIGFSLFVDGKLVGSYRDIGFKSDGPRYVIPKAAETKLDDFSSKSWKNALAERCDVARKVVKGFPEVGVVSPAHWKGKNDLSFDLKTKWTPEGIGFLLTVKDNTLRLPRTDKEKKSPWACDCIELFVDFRQENERKAAFSAGAMQFGIIPQDTETPTPCEVLEPSPYPYMAKLECWGKKTSDGYQIRGLIKVIGELRKFTPGEKLSLDVLINDNDDIPGKGDQLGQRVRMALHGNANNYQNTSTWGNYVLKK